jgi:hypothetical protein
MKIKTSAVTLVELIIATLLVSMVVAGVLSAEYGLRRISENGAGDVQTAIQTKSLADAVRTAIKNLHISPVDHGITILISTRTICFQHDIEVSGVFTPADYNDDSHTCFTQIGTSVYRCERSPAASCGNTDLLVGALVADQFTRAMLRPSLSKALGVWIFRMVFVGRRNPAEGAAITGGALTSGTNANPQTVVNVFEKAGF